MNFKNLTNPDQLPVDGDLVEWYVNDRRISESFDINVFERLLKISKRNLSEGMYPVDFRRLFTFTELSQIDNHQYSDTFTAEMKANINTFIQTYKSTLRVHLNNSETIQAIRMMVAYGILTQERADLILVGELPNG